MTTKKVNDSGSRSFNKFYKELNNQLGKKLQKSSLLGKFKLRADRGTEEIELNICFTVYKRVNKL